MTDQKTTEELNAQHVSPYDLAINQIVQNRKRAYPSIEQQLDMLYWDKINGTENWQTAIDAVKQQFPKPE